MSQQITREDVQHAVEAGITKVFLSAGVDLSSPAAMIAAQQDFNFLRDFRLSTERVKSYSLKTIAVTVTSGLLAALGYAFRGSLPWLGGGPTH